MNPLRQCIQYAALRALRRDVQALHSRATKPAADAPSAALRSALRRSHFRGNALHEATAAVHAAARETLGLAPFDTQWIAALSLLRGWLAEMGTGEGKTLAMALAASVAALGGRHVHVITANDYLVERDAQRMRPLFERLGLQVGSVTTASPPHARQAAYACGIVYVTARELVFDALRDAQAKHPNALPLHRHADALGGSDASAGYASASYSGECLGGFDMALIDEADAVLLDEAQMPLILSRPVPPSRDMLALPHALALARRLVSHVDFEPGIGSARASLTLTGRARLAAMEALGAGAHWINALHRADAVERALAALHGLERDRDYLVQDKKVVLIDAVTGRAVPGRGWTQGLHELVALKEGCSVPPRSEPMAQLTYPQFFRRYRHLAGMSGTLQEDAGELHRLYGLRVLPVPLRQASRRRVLPTRVFRRAADRWQAVAQRAAELAAAGRPVLIGTDSVGDSQALAEYMRAAGCAFVMLHAAQDSNEASIVAQAGEPGRITVATNMAGRGTDIPLAPGVAEAGGLHVLSCQSNPSRRLDRQLAGRCARQGDAGSAEHWLLWTHQPTDVPAWIARSGLRWLQVSAERAAARDRRRLMEIDRRNIDRLAFALPAA